jgi:NAD(P) transhydrogenase subunit beta
MDSFHSTWAPLLYLAAGILFILALRGLSSPATSRAGNRNGMIGMAIAVGTTLALLWGDLDLTTWGLILAVLPLVACIGAIIARRIPMTAMPQLVAAFHSLVGMAAVLVAAAALLLARPVRHRRCRHQEVRRPDRTGLGSAIGALTFTGSVIAFAKLNGACRASRSCCRPGTCSTSLLRCRHCRPSAST